MAYGLRVENSSGLLVISDERLVPWFAGKATVASATATGQAFGGFQVFKHIVSYTGLPNSRYMIATTLPENVGEVWYSPVDTIAGTTGGFDLYVMRANGVATHAAPEVYLFGVDAPPTPTITYGLRVVNSAGVRTFDSGRSPLMIREVKSFSLLPLSGGADVYSSMPAKPAFLCFDFEQWTAQLSGLNTIFGTYRSMFRRVDNTVYGDVKQVHSEIEALQQNYILNYGVRTAQPVPVINAAHYD